MKKSKKIIVRLSASLLALLLLVLFVVPAFAAEDIKENANTTDTAITEQSDTAAEVELKSTKAIAAAIVIAIVAAAGAIGMAIAISKSNDGIARQPEAGSQIRTSLMLGLVFIETAIIYALIVAILIIFVL